MHARLIACLLVASATPLIHAQDSAPVLLSKEGGASMTPAQVEAAAKKGDPKACAKLGEWLVSGAGVPKDVPRGIAFLDKAARAGEPNAAFRLGMLFDDGEGVTQDHVKALAYFHAAAAGGLPEAFYNIGTAYVGGHGVKRDYVEALAWLSLAEKHGAEGAGAATLRNHLRDINHPDWIEAGEKRALEITDELAGKDPASFLPPIASADEKQNDELMGSLAIVEDVASAYNEALASPALRLSNPAGSSFNGLDRPPQPIYQEAPRYPSSMAAAGIEGTVTVDFVIDPKGNVVTPFVLSSTNPVFDQSAVQAVSSWKFRPGLKNGNPVYAHIQTPIKFRIEGGGQSAFSVTGDPATLPPQFQYDNAPEVTKVVPLVYPYELLCDKVSGSATVLVVLSDTGSVLAARVFKASRPEFGEALLASASTWTFKPAMRKGKPTSTIFGCEQVFDTYGTSRFAQDATLLRKLRSDPKCLTGYNDLDHYSGRHNGASPAFPSSLDGKVKAGSATIEIVVDQDGLARLPRVISATEPEFGYAAAQGLATWRFDPPTFGGKPTMFRVRVPVNFVL